jgi:TATA-box binding protein (TBP) (component of TFIID and TFIIIB)
MTRFDSQNDFSECYLDLNELAHRNETCFGITTITYSFDLNTKCIDLCALKTRFDVENVVVKPDKVRKKKGDQRNDFFFNQITLEYTTVSKKSIKLFKNGRVHITGISSIVECNVLTDMICDWLNNIFLDEMFSVVEDSKKVLLINANLSTSTTFSLKRWETLLRRQNAEYVYHPDSHPALKIIHQTSDGISNKILLFRTGNVMITSTTSIHFLKQSVYWFFELLSVYEKMECRIQLKTTRRITSREFYRNLIDQSVEYIDGYSIKDLLCAQRNKEE